jgi:hypothetical protein
MAQIDHDRLMLSVPYHKVLTGIQEYFGQIKPPSQAYIYQ